MRRVLLALLLVAPPVVAQQPKADTPEVREAKARVAEATDELKRQQRLQATGAGSADRVDVAEFQAHAAGTALAELTRGVKAEHAAREAEVKVLARRWERATKAGESPEGVDARLRELADGRARLARFNGDRPALVKEHAALVEVAQRRLDRAQYLLERKIGVAAEVQNCEVALLAERERLADAKAARLTPRNVD